MHNPKFVGTFVNVFEWDVKFIVNVLAENWMRSSRVCG
jgi:hypothetical protein